MDRSGFLKALQAASRDLHNAFTSPGQKWLTAVIAGENEDTSKDLKLDRIYELLCCFALIHSLKSNVQNLRVISGTGHKGFRFPYSPGKKENFAFFRFEKDNSTYDVCCGTKIPAPNGEPDEAPDISLQLKMGVIVDVNKSCGEPIALWDAKYHKERPAKADVQQMFWWCNIFELPKYHSGDILQKILPPTFQVSAVITNVSQAPLNRSMLLEKRFSVVFNFQGDTSSVSPTPSRSEHEAQP